MSAKKVQHHWSMEGKKTKIICKEKLWGPLASIRTTKEASICYLSSTCRQ
jgi:hypothetical protein